MDAERVRQKSLRGHELRYKLVGGVTRGKRRKILENFIDQGLEADDTGEPPLDLELNRSGLEVQFHQLLTVRLFSTAVFLQERAECGRRRRRSRDLQPQCRGRERHSLRKKRKRLFKKQICRAEKSFARRARSGSGMCISARGVGGHKKLRS